MKGHHYRITVEHTANPKGTDELHAPLTFEAINHDEVLAIVDRARANSGFPPDEAAQFAMGLKLLGEVMLKHRDDPLFADLREPYRAFIGRVKARNAPAA
ncbi:hypothetical protein BGLT_04526 [Caballeronia glathei]|uniref:DUF3861 domain-containing protein n=1 Tax=Caballeronia glathei TaxID=60547 RepID=A0A069PSU3_9BURK|nr:DUF3861 domain-containing protein [Caballeronia glathei]KDR43828.1 hypothetical protein BG61_29070 [Caballeronia glathei]CDY75627.1 hypothetical protein BGLT_04526 [Caballeronia glathei]